MAESTAHRRLKHLAAMFLREQGCLAVAAEVRCPRSRFRADIAGYWDRLPAGPRESCGTLWGEPVGVNAGAPRRIEPRTILIECKQSRGDFLRECADREQLLSQRDRLRGERARFESQEIPRFEPHLREAGTALFEEMESWAFERSRLAGYRRVARLERTIERKLYGETKFFLARRYRLADRLYLLAPAGLLRASELPEGWGLLEAPARLMHGSGRLPRDGVSSCVRVRVAAPKRRVDEAQRAELLRNIAVSASRDAFRVPA